MGNVWNKLSANIMDSTKADPPQTVSQPQPGANQANAQGNTVAAASKSSSGAGPMDTEGEEPSEDALEAMWQNHIEQNPELQHDADRDDKKKCFLSIQRASKRVKKN